jgi:hypothetical protein
MSNSVKLVECPRDAWQGLKGQIPAYIKTDYLKALISAGFKHIVRFRLSLEIRSADGRFGGSIERTRSRR